MKSHPLDNVALVFGVGGLIAGLFALLHQSGALTLGLPAVAAIATLTVGIGGITLAVLEARRS